MILNLYKIKWEEKVSKYKKENGERSVSVK